MSHSSCQTARLLNYTCVWVVCFMFAVMFEFRQCKLMDVCLKWPFLFVGTLIAMFDYWIWCLNGSDGIYQLNFVNSSSYLWFHCDAAGMVCTCGSWMVVNFYHKLEHYSLQLKNFTVWGTYQGMIFGTILEKQLLYNE